MFVYKLRNFKLNINNVTIKWLTSIIKTVYYVTIEKYIGSYMGQLSGNINFYSTFFWTSFIKKVNIKMTTNIKLFLSYDFLALTDQSLDMLSVAGYSHVADQIILD